MIDFTVLDITGDNLFNGLDLLVFILSVIFYTLFYKTVIKHTLGTDLKKEVSKLNNVKYITGKEVMNEIERMDREFDGL